MVQGNFLTQKFINFFESLEIIKPTSQSTYILTDYVSKSNGLIIKVMGNSLIVSTKTKCDPTNIGPWRRGR